MDVWNSWISMDGERSLSCQYSARYFRPSTACIEGHFENHGASLERGKTRTNCYSKLLFIGHHIFSLAERIPSASYVPWPRTGIKITPLWSSFYSMQVTRASTRLAMVLCVTPGREEPNNWVPCSVTFAATSHTHRQWVNMLCFRNVSSNVLISFFYIELPGSNVKECERFRYRICLRNVHCPS